MPNPPRYHMIVDVERCTGCHACAVACKVENDVPLARVYAVLLESGIRNTDRPIAVTSGLVRPSALGPRDEFKKFIDNNRAFAARVANETGMQPQ